MERRNKNEIIKDCYQRDERASKRSLSKMPRKGFGLEECQRVVIFFAATNVSRAKPSECDPSDVADTL